MDKKRITIVAPAFNEAEGVAHFARAVATEMAGLPYDYSILFVNDGSTDGTREVLEKLHEEDPEHFGVIHLSRNFGHQAALTAGMDHADGDAVITMDSDMQHPPRLLPELLRRWEERNDIVQTVRKNTQRSGWFKSAASRGFYALVNEFSSTRIEPNASDFRLLSRRVVELFRRDLRERDRFLRGLVSWVGFRIAWIEFEAPPRYSGGTKYSVRKMTSLAQVGLISFSRVPLRLAVVLGLTVSAVSLLYGLFALFAWFFFNRAVVPGWASIILVSTFLGGANLLFLGILGAYVASIVEEIKERPIYIVDAVLTGGRHG
ncbi:MAG TPA: glycosyltransferase family 2 protein [Thermoanaerobaculia bacterium]|nr:glycosyltransferase family 2 protein [Thermoanaerobaculia bacterium]